MSVDVSMIVRNYIIYVAMMIKNMQFIMLLLPVKDNEGHTGP